MSDFLRHNWFVVVIAIIIISFVCYFVYDENKYNVSKMTDSDGSQVVASMDEANITAQDIYEESKDSDNEILYNAYRNLVVNQAIKTTDEIEKQAKEYLKAFEANQSSTTDLELEQQVQQELAAYGFTDSDDLYDFYLMTVKQTEMQRDYIEEHFDETTKALQEKKPRTISILSMQVESLDSLTEDEQKKKDNIDFALEKESFADAATAYSEDTSTASNDGFYGYIDTDAASSSTLNSAVIDAATKLEKGETSDWIEVTDSSTGLFYLYRVHVDQTDLKKMWNSKNETVSNNVLSAILNANEGLDVKIVEDYAKDLDIKFKDDETEKKINDYISSRTGDEDNEK